jgi:hypothetical protein
MKIIKKVGERLLPSWLATELRPVLAFGGAGAALWAGTCELICRAWKATDSYDTRERVFALAVAAYLTAYGCWHAPHIARFAIPGAVIAWCVAAWCVAPASEPQDESEDEDEPDPQDVTDLVRDLVGDDTGVLLTALCQPLRAADTRAVREVLAAADITVRPGVRTPAGNGPGVHRNDLPAPPLLCGCADAERCLCRSEANANANNALRVEFREGMTIISDPADRHRAHSLKKAP